MNWKVHGIMDGAWGRTGVISPLLMRLPTAAYLMLLMRFIPSILDVFCNTNYRDKGVLTCFTSALSDFPVYRAVLCIHLSVWPLVHVPQNSTVMSVSNSAIPALCPLCPTFFPIISWDGRILKSWNTNQVQFSDWVGWEEAIPKS